MHRLLSLVVVAVLACTSLTGCHRRAHAQAVVRVDPAAANSSAARTAALARIEAVLAASPLVDATVVLGRGSGDVVVFSKGAGGANVVYKADSAQKWLLATLLLREARKRHITLEQPLSTWPSAPAWATGAVGDITLRDLLSFTSGFENPPLCAKLAEGKGFDDCLLDLVHSPLHLPRRYFYGTHHMMVALGALFASEAPVDETKALLERFREETRLLKTAQHNSDKPLTLTITPMDYAAFLRALMAGQLLTPDEMTAMFADQIGDKDVAQSPADAAIGRGDLQGRWRYGLGNWFRCDVGVPCDSEHHSAGSRGFYPFVDLKDGSFGVVAHVARFGDWSESHRLFEAIRNDIDLVVGPAAAVPASAVGVPPTP
jgi:hypothetical protein